MKICLVSSPTVSEFDVRVADARDVRRISEQAPLGILALAAVLEQCGIAAEIVDLNRIYYRYLRSKCKVDFCAYAAGELASRSFDVCGFSTLCSTYPLTLRIAGEVKRSRPQTHIVLGGPQASAVDVRTLAIFPFIDCVVRGEADETFPVLVDGIGNMSRLSDIPGITFRRGKKIIRNPDAPVVLDLDKLPMPAFHLNHGLETCWVVPLELGRGCPFGCKFCSTANFFGRRFRLKSPGRVIEQMRTIRKTYDKDCFDLIHDTFTVDRKRVVDFCRALLAGGDRFKWSCSSRTDCLDDELIKLMKSAGCIRIFLGIETGSISLQKEISKGLDLSEAAARIHSAASNGVSTTVSLITGFPTETPKDLQSTVAFLMDAARSDLTKPLLHILAPLAGTPLYEQYRNALILDDILSDVSCHGWRQDPADRELVRSHPDIFPNFYGLSSPLGRQYIKELVDFIQNGLLRFRWLLVGLHQDSGDLIAVFEAWRNWLGAKRQVNTGQDSDLNSVPYYARAEFARDLLDFIGTCYLSQSGNPAAIGTLLDFESALYRSHRPPRVPKACGAPRIARGVRIISVRGDYHRVLDCLRNRKSLNSIRNRRVYVAARHVNGEKLKVIKLRPLPAQIMNLCNGARSIPEIAHLLHPGKDLAGIPLQKICLFGLASLREQGLVQFC